MSASKEASALAAQSTGGWSSSGANMSACVNGKHASGRQRRSENMSASESVKHAWGKRPSSANMKKSGKESATARS